MHPTATALSSTTRLPAPTSALVPLSPPATSVAVPPFTNLPTLLPIPTIVCLVINCFTHDADLVNQLVY